MPTSKRNTSQCRSLPTTKSSICNEYFPQLYKSVMRCEGHDIAATKSSIYVDKLYKLLISLFVVS